MVELDIYMRGGGRVKFATGSSFFMIIVIIVIIITI